VSGDLDRAFEAARAQWPDLQVDGAAFKRQLEANGARSFAHAPDLYLVFACAHGETAAIRTLTKLAEREVDRALRHLGQGKAFAEDISQQLLAKLLVTRKVEAYVGRGPLSAWLRAAAVRTALNVLETVKPQTSVSRSLPAAGARADDPELQHLRRRYGPLLKGAVEGALRELGADDRNVLRFYFVDGLTVEQIARIRGSHKSTVSRLITRVRKELLEQVRGALVDKGHARADELSSVLRAVVSQLDVSLERALR
jgi:RNA polymerase sigma-70 factor, ECF subfamily